ncbi:MAG: acyl-CoA dehydrogenase family protein [Candidatus Rokubacteria bacterium]|nr:acyl-CoA dehydrogenase family protein [Candidatus Rokubacteria bacterium]
MSLRARTAHPIVDTVRRFVEDEVVPVASALEHADRYPHELVARMKALGLFGALVPAEHGGLGLPVSVYARVIEELCRGFMSLAGVINSHTMAALIVLNHGTDEQRRRFLPRFAAGEARGGLCLTEPHAGTDVQAIRTVARRRGDEYVIDGAKMFITNGREGNTFALLAVTDPAATPRHRGMSCFVVEKGHPGFRVLKSIRKLGYKAVDTVEILFEDFVVPAANLVGGVEGRGFRQVMGGLETGRINIAARCVGVAQAALEAVVTRARGQATVEPALADLATRVHASRLLTYWAGAMKDRGERCDLEAGMAKLYASESAQQVAVDALRLHGADGTLESLTVERHYRDTPLMIIGEGTNEIQRVLIARNLLERYGERFGALTSREDEPDERKAMALAVRQLVDRAIASGASEWDAERRYPAEVIEQLADLGLFGALVPPEYGGLGLDLRTVTVILEELGRGAVAPAAVVAAQLAAAAAIARHGTPAQRERLLPPMTRAEMLVVPVVGARLDARPAGDGFALSGVARAVDNAPRAAAFLVAGRLPDGSVASFLVPRERVSLGAPRGTIGGRGLDPADVTVDTVVGDDARVGRGGEAAEAAEALARLGAAAIAVGVAQAAFEAALRYSQQRTTFGQPICQHQAIQLKLADMSTAITASRLLVYDAAGADPAGIAMAKIEATETAYRVTLESMRIHGGYGYTAEFPIERYYRDAARLLVTPTGNDDERRRLARLVAG